MSTTITVDYEAIAATIEHRPDCADPTRWRLRRNVHVVCVACGHFQPIDTPIQADQAEQSAESSQEPPESPEFRQEPARWTSWCTDCGTTLTPATGRPQLALCDPCRDARQAAADEQAARRRARRAADQARLSHRR